MSKTKFENSKSDEYEILESQYDVSIQTAALLMETNLLQVCLNSLTFLTKVESAEKDADENILQTALSSDMQYLYPFLSKHELKSSYVPLFSPNITQLTETICRMMYQMIKVFGKQIFYHNWFMNNTNALSYILCDLATHTDNQTVRRLIRKLLLVICGTKDNYRHLKDRHTIEVHSNSVIQFVASYNETKECYNVTFGRLVQITEDLKYCYEIALLRPANWQNACLTNPTILISLFKCCNFHTEEVLQNIILKMISLALCQCKMVKAELEINLGKEGILDNTTTDFAKQAKSLCKTIFPCLMPTLFQSFVEKFLIDQCSQSLKWQAHQIVFAFYKFNSDTQKTKFAHMFWNLFKETSGNSKTPQHFIDLLAYFDRTSHLNKSDSFEYCRVVIQTICDQLHTLAEHSSSHIYPYLHYILDTEGLYFDTEPCMLCNTTDIQPASFKLTAIKADARFTTSSMILKLVQTYCISKIFIRISDVKKSKMVRSINIYYSNHNIQATVDLKSKLDTWRKGKQVKMLPGQTDVRVDFALPITACNLMIEYAEFYETIVGCTETLQCPRCSAIVSSSPGICGNCGENVFQCHKCRAINYDEKVCIG